MELKGEARRDHEGWRVGGPQRACADQPWFGEFVAPALARSTCWDLACAFGLTALQPRCPI